MKMGDHNNLKIQQEIGQNLSVASNQNFALNEEELAFNSRQAWINNRSMRRKPNVEKLDQQHITPERVNKKSTDAVINLNIHEAVDRTHITKQWVNNVAANQAYISPVTQNNRVNSESIDTIRENIKNSQDYSKRQCSDTILTIEEASSKAANSITSLGKKWNDTSEKDVKQRNIQGSNKKRISSESIDTLNESTDDLKQSFRSSSAKDPHTAAIDLSNNCRQFYLNHVKAADAIKKSVRAAKHDRAKEKTEGKPWSRIDDVMDRLRSEMADLMDQDVSLMSQLLKLNDKIEEVKTQMIYNNRNDSSSQSTLCHNEISETDSEVSDNEDGRTGSSVVATRNQNNYGVDTEQSEASIETPPKRISPTDSQIIVYRKVTKRKKGNEKNSHADLDPDDNATVEEESDTSESDTSCSPSDTESTISYNSCNTVSDATKVNKHKKSHSIQSNQDSGIQSLNEQPPEIPKPVKGGVSQNSRFLNFHKTNGSFKTTSGLNPVLTLRGHNISLEKYYVPQGLVYLKHSNSDNVFCQFSN